MTSPNLPTRRRAAAGLAACLALPLLALSFTACGKKGDPEPPLRTSPARTTELRVSQRGEELLITFPYPTTTAAGLALEGVQEVVVYQATAPIPESERELLEPGDETAAITTLPDEERTEEDEPEEPDDTDFYAETGIRAADEVDEMEANREVGREMTEVGEKAEAEEEAAKAENVDGEAVDGDDGDDGDDEDADDEDADDYVPLTPAQRFRRLLKPLDARQLEGSSQVLARFAGDDLASAVAGGEVDLAVPLPRPLPEEPEIRYLTVRTIGPDGEASDLSQQGVIVVLPPPPAPSGLQVEGTAEGIRVAWQPQGEVVGYNLYRRNVRSRLFDVPVAVPTSDRTDYVDRTAQLGESYVYAVTAVARRVPLVESAVTQVQEIAYRDVFAPPAPGNLVALAEDGRVRVLWDDSEADDLAGYRLSRRAGDGEYTSLTAEPGIDTEYSDTDVTPGVTYTYRVEAVDETGNTSDPVEASTEAR